MKDKNPIKLGLLNTTYDYSKMISLQASREVKIIKQNHSNTKVSEKKGPRLVLRRSTNRGK